MREREWEIDIVGEKESGRVRGREREIMSEYGRASCQLI